MNNLFLYQSIYEKKNDIGDLEPTSVTIIFCERSDLEMVEIQGAIKKFYERNNQTDEVFVICGNYNKEIVIDLFFDKREESFKDIPRLEIDHLTNHLYIISFDHKGALTSHNNKQLPEKLLLDQIIKDGLVNVFKTRGGLIEANGNAHHFVFPSGKHSEKFLRTGNILLYSSEIYFIAFNLLSHYKEEEHKKIFCDTSSINTVAFALLDLKRKLIGDSFNAISIISFSSYSGLFSNKIQFFNNSLVLISSSTSGNIIDKLTEHDERINTSNIVILFYLGSQKNYSKRRDNIICNLTKSNLNLNGIAFYETYTDKDCIYCKKGSYPVEINGDVFLLEKPKINRITIKVSDAPKNLSSFVEQFRSTNRVVNNVLKVNYKENLSTHVKYEIYFDMYHILENLDTKYGKYKEKLFDYINQHIPSNLKYLICLPDEGSIKLANVIVNQIKDNYKPEKLPLIINFNDVPSGLQNKEEIGAAVIVGSCISNGKNLLYISRALRPYEKLRLTYFIGLVRTSDQEYKDFLKSNLTQGRYGKNTNLFVEVENLFCNKDSKETSWINEKEFLQQLIEDIEEKGHDYNLSYFKDRVKLIDDSMSVEKKGLSNMLFYPNTSNEELKLRKGFAFFTFRNYADDVSQADVYFTISAVINNLRCNTHGEQNLSQTEFVRNIIDPGNFNRYNDGIIQACILRSAKPSELCYHIDENLSSDMASILEKIISDHTKDQGEGLIEFLYAISIEKLTLKKEHLRSLMGLLKDVNNDIAMGFKYYIEENIMKSKLSFTEEIALLKEEIRSLKNVTVE